MSEERIFEQERGYMEVLAAEEAILQMEHEEHQRDYFRYLDWLVLEEKCRARKDGGSLRTGEGL